MPDSFRIFGEPRPLAGERAAHPSLVVHMLDGTTRTRAELDAAVRVLTGTLARSPERGAAAAELLLSPRREDRDLGEDYLRGSVVICADMAQDVDPDPAPGIGHNGHLFEALNFDEGRAVMRLLGFGFLVLAFIAGISVAMAAPGKIARTGAEFDRIEELR